MTAGFAVIPDNVIGDTSEEVDLQTIIDTQDRLAQEAREVLPYSFDECTYSKGPLRQNVWSCLDCGEKGVCYGCSISCHSDHRLVELWTKRSFQCDCPTTSMAIASSSGSSKRRCSLNPAEEQPQSPNEGNRYSQNFSGKFCRCGRDYDPETEVEAMIHCIGCEDWFHESCLNLQPRRTTQVDDDEDEEADCLIPSDLYDGLVCASCANSHPLIAERKGRDGWMVLEPADDGGWKVVGKADGADGKTTECATAVNTSDTDKAESSKRSREEEEEAASKKARVENVPNDIPTESKNARVEDAEEEVSTLGPVVVPSVGSQPTESTAVSTPRTTPTPRKCAGDIFLGHGIRARLAAELASEIAESLPFPLVDEEIYEPPRDEEPVQTLEEVTERVVGALPRVQAIEAVHGYQAMKDRLKVMLAGHAASGQAVSRQDIETFFEELREARGAQA